MVDQDRQCRPALADELLGDEVFRQGAQNQVFPVQADGFFMQASGQPPHGAPAPLRQNISAVSYTHLRAHET